MRRLILALAAFALCGSASAFPSPQEGHVHSAHAERPAPEALDLAVSNGRKLPIQVWNGEGKGPVVIFLHGMGGQPSAYQALFDQWAATGITVVAPTEPDSRSNPDFAKIDLPTGFAMRAEDMMVTRGYVAQRFAGRKVFLAGHSYGSLFAMMGGGAVTAAGPLAGPPVAGVVAFSTPGKIKGVVLPTTFASVKVPMLVMTGTNDIVPGFVPDSADHRFPFDTAPAGGKTLITFADAGHDFVAKPGKAASSAAALSMAFIATLASGNAEFIASFRALTSTTGFTVEHR